MAKAKKAASKKPAPKKAAPKKPSAKKAAPAAASAAEKYDPNKDRHALRELQARHGGVDNDHRAAFDDLSDNARRAELGGKTRAAGVLREGVRWAVAIDQAFTRFPALVKEHYSRRRFAYLLDRLAALDSAIDAHHAHRGGLGAVHSAATDRYKTARSARTMLLGKMRGFAGHRAAERAALDEATGRTDNAEALGKSLRDLVALGRSWIGRGDSKSAILASSAGLSDRALNDALAAALGLTGAATDATLAGRRPSIDAPEVNVIEGWVLHEMAEAQRCFDVAHETTQIVPRLNAGPATRNVLGSRKGNAKADAEPDAEPDATPT